MARHYNIHSLLVTVLSRLKFNHWRSVPGFITNFRKEDVFVQKEKNTERALFKMHHLN